MAARILGGKRWQLGLVQDMGEYRTLWGVFEKLNLRLKGEGDDLACAPYVAWFEKSTLARISSANHGRFWLTQFTTRLCLFSF